VKVAAIILAGGKSSRMGRDKATIEIDGIPLLRRIYDVVAGCNDGQIGSIAGTEGKTFDGIYIVTPWIEKYRPMLPIDCNFIIEEDPHKGPLVGFAQGLSQIEADWILLLACDLPNLSTSFIQNSTHRLNDIPAGSMAYLAKYEGGWETLCGFYRGNCLESLQAYINGGGQSFQGWLKTKLVTEMPILPRKGSAKEDPQILLNCNTPADLAEIIDRPIPTPARSKIE
jgi:molybdenum cofactor guanylyltransferase